QAALAPDAGRTLVAMSGGVDSAVAALLAGEGSVAVTLELWADPANDAEASCCSAHAVRVARSVAHSMGMPHFTLDLRDEFRAGVVDPFLSGYAAGETPNPCVGCNGHVRLDAMPELTKPEVRALAGEAELPVADRPDSQDLCFLAGVGKARFLARHGGLSDSR